MFGQIGIIEFFVSFICSIKADYSTEPLIPLL
jgi:hypothetical protein